MRYRLHRDLPGRRGLTHGARVPGPLHAPVMALALVAGTIVVIAATVAVVAAASGGGEPPLTPRLELATGAEPPPLDSVPRLRRMDGVYAATTAHRVSRRLAGYPERVYVPNTNDGTVVVIDPRTYRIVRRFRTGSVPQHITPAWNMRRLYVNNNQGNSLTVVDPRSGRPRRTIPVHDPYNLYFTPDGRRAVVVAEREMRLDLRDPRSWRLIRSVPIPYPGVDHLDFSAGGRYLMASTEFSGMVVRVSLRTMRVTGTVSVGGLPVDVKLAPDGRYFYVTNQGRGGVSVVDPVAMREVRFVPTGRGAHGLCVSRDATRLYVSNRMAGSISVVDAARGRVVRTWHTGGSPDMLQVSPNGRRLWASDRYNGSVTVVNTRTGKVVKRIHVGSGPHGLAYFPQPGRFSVGHNGVYR